MYRKMTASPYWPQDGDVGKRDSEL